MSYHFFKSFCTIAAVALSALPASAGSPQIVDFTKPAPIVKPGSGVLFDEDVIQASNFALFERDPRLSDLFTASGKSELCFPTALAQQLAFQFGYGEPRVTSLQLPGLTTNGSGLAPDVAIRALAVSCETDRDRGTRPVPGLRCTIDLLKRSGFAADQVALYSPNALANAEGLPVKAGEWSLAQLRSLLASGSSVILELGWFAPSPDGKSFVRNGGHFVSVIGYEYDATWGERQLNLKVINPDLSYDATQSRAVFDTVTLEAAPKRAGLSYPASSDGFTLVGNGFQSLNFVERLIVFKAH